jgi:hypothetical protein
MALELASLNRGYREKVPFFRGATYARDKSAAPGLPQGLPNNVVSHDLELRKTQCKPTERYGGFHGHGDIPSSLDGLFHGKPEHQIDDDWGYPHFGRPLFLEKVSIWIPPETAAYF